MITINKEMLISKQELGIHGKKDAHAKTCLKLSKTLAAYLSASTLAKTKEKKILFQLAQYEEALTQWISGEIARPVSVLSREALDKLNSALMAVRNTGSASSPRPNQAQPNSTNVVTDQHQATLIHAAASMPPLAPSFSLASLSLLASSTSQISTRVNLDLFKETNNLLLKLTDEIDVELKDSLELAIIRAKLCYQEVNPAKKLALIKDILRNENQDESIDSLEDLLTRVNPLLQTESSLLITLKTIVANLKIMQAHFMKTESDLLATSATSHNTSPTPGN